MLPKLFEIGDFFLPTYGVLVAAAFLTALWLAGRLARREGLNPEDVTNLGDTNNLLTNFRRQLAVDGCLHIIYRHPFGSGHLSFYRCLKHPRE